VLWLLPCKFSLPSLRSLWLLEAVALVFVRTLWIFVARFDKMCLECWNFSPPSTLPTHLLCGFWNERDGSSKKLVWLTSHLSRREGRTRLGCARSMQVRKGTRMQARGITKPETDRNMQTHTHTLCLSLSIYMYPKTSVMGCIIMVPCCSPCWEHFTGIRANFLIWTTLQPIHCISLSALMCSMYNLTCWSMSSASDKLDIDIVHSAS